MYISAIRRVAVRVQLRPSAPRSLQARRTPSAPLSTRASAPSGNARFVASLRARAGARYYATRSRGTQTGTKSSTRAPAKSKTTKKTTRKSTKKSAKKPKKASAKKPKARKVVTPEAKLIAKVNQLKREALLAEPKYKPTSVWTIVSAEPGAGRGVSREAMAARKSRYTSLSTSERQTYQDEADANKRSNEVIKKQFVESFTPYQVFRANLARSALARYAKQPVPQGRKRALVARKQFGTLVDARVPKRPMTAYFQFVNEMRQNGRLTGTNVTDQSKHAKRQWDGLSQGEKKRYNDIYVFQREEYDRKMKALMPERYQKKGSATTS